VLGRRNGVSAQFVLWDLLGVHQWAMGLWDSLSLRPHLTGTALMSAPPPTNYDRFQVHYPGWLIEHPWLLSHVQPEAPC
jgi:hypothetical protein